MVFCPGYWFELASKYFSVFKLCKGVMLKLLLHFRFFVWVLWFWVCFFWGVLWFWFFIFVVLFNSTFCFGSDGVGDRSSKVMLLVSGNSGSKNKAECMEELLTNI